MAAATFAFLDDLHLEVRGYADPDEIAHVTQVDTAQLNAQARPWIWGRPQLQALINSVTAGCGLHRYPPNEQTTARTRTPPWAAPRGSAPAGRGQRPPVWCGPSASP
jgi:hypothetical protein